MYLTVLQAILYFTELHGRKVGHAGILTSRVSKLLKIFTLKVHGKLKGP